MFNHAPTNYICPICLGIKGIENEQTLLKKADLVYQDKHFSAFINSFWIGKNDGHVIIVPNEHIENIYDLSTELGQKIFEIIQRIALAMKATYLCDGITLRQNNEPAGDQHAFHFHLHIFPRYENDDFNQQLALKSRLSDPNDRIKFSELLKNYLKENYE